MDALHLFSSQQLCVCVSVHVCVCVCEHFLSSSVFLNYPPSFHLLWVWVGLYSPGGFNVFCASKTLITHKFYTHTSHHLLLTRRNDDWSLVDLLLLCLSSTVVLVLTRFTWIRF